jgi:hypothetical protein
MSRWGGGNHQQAVLNWHGINIEDITGNTTGSPEPPKVWSTLHSEEILIQSSRSAPDRAAREVGFMVGITICKAHGRAGFVETCSHVAKQIDERKPPSGRRFFVLPLRLFVCDSCFTSSGLEQFAHLADLPWEEQLDALDPNAEKALSRASRPRC